MRGKIFPFIIGAIICIILTHVPRVYAYCGDGIVESDNGEVCDDGNFFDRDGCSSYCKTEDLTPPNVTNISIAANADNVPTNTKTISIVFSEPIDPAIVNGNMFSIFYDGNQLSADLSLSSDKITVILSLKETLKPESTNAIRIKNVRDLAGNIMAEEFIRTFKTAVFVDTTPPFIVSDPPAGTYSFPQNVVFIAYLSENQTGLAFKEEGVRVYYTLDGSYPTETSALFSSSFVLGEHTVLRFFGIDSSGNRSQVFTQVYNFGCAERPNAKRMSPYPLCRILECNTNFKLLNNACIPKIKTEADETDYMENAFTAPLFSSVTPLFVSSKSAIHITAEHKGIIKRPIIFRNLNRESEVYFEKDTVITDDAGKAFEGYLIPPVGRYSKEFPINFGYAFKSILEFVPPDGKTLHFSKPYQIVVSLGERFDQNKPVSVFTLLPGANQYVPLAENKVVTDWSTKKTTVFSDKTDIFFICQAGENFNRAVFDDMENHWAKNYAEILYRQNIVKGRSKGVFAPDEPLTRAEFTKIALEALGAEVDPLETVEDSPFPDVPLYAWYVGYVKKAKELGFIHGYPDGTFHPEQPINRAEAIKILLTAFGFDLSKADTFHSETDFSDVMPDAWYYQTMNFAIQNKLLDGIRTPNGTILKDFGPARDITRGEMAKLTIETQKLAEEMKK